MSRYFYCRANSQTSIDHSRRVLTPSIHNPLSIPRPRSVICKDRYLYTATKNIAVSVRSLGRTGISERQLCVLREKTFLMPAKAVKNLKYPACTEANFTHNTSPVIIIAVAFFG